MQFVILGMAAVSKALPTHLVPGACCENSSFRRSRAQRRETVNQLTRPFPPSVSTVILFLPLSLPKLLFTSMRTTAHKSKDSIFNFQSCLHLYSDCINKFHHSPSPLLNGFLIYLPTVDPYICPPMAWKILLEHVPCAVRFS